MKKLSWILLFGALTACADDSSGGADIVSMTISPSTIKASDTGMTDEFFTVSVTLTGFDDVTAEDVVVYRVEPTRVDAEPGSRVLDGDTVTLSQIAKSWFTGLDVGTYAIGAEVDTASGQIVRRLDLTTVTIEP